MKNAILTAITAILCSACAIIGTVGTLNKQEITYDIPKPEFTIVGFEEDYENYEIKPETEEILVVDETTAEETHVVEETTAPEPEPVPEMFLTQDEINIIALIIRAEAGTESDYGKRLVIDTILNRVDSYRFPNTVMEVVYAPNQYECTYNGSCARFEVEEHIVQLIKEECMSRTNYDVFFYCNWGYPGNGPALFQYEHHYFEGLY